MLILADARQWGDPELWETYKPKAIITAVGIDHKGFDYQVQQGMVFIVPRACVDS